MTDYDDLQIGASVWSKTMQDSLGMRGGVIIALDDIGETVTTLADFHPSRGPRPLVLPYDDLEMGTYMPEVRNAGASANQLFRWLAEQTRTFDGRKKYAEWAQTAATLQAIRESEARIKGAK